MTKSSSMHRKVMSWAASVPFAQQIWTTLEHVLHTALSRWSPAEEAEYGSSEVYGCENCRLIVEISVFYREDEGYLVCPECSGAIRELGVLPYSIEDEDGAYLTNDTRVMGPYNSAKDAQRELWAWFNNEGEHAKRKEGKWKRDKGLRLVSIDGKEVDQGVSSR